MKLKMFLIIWFYMILLIFPGLAAVETADQLKKIDRCAWGFRDAKVQLPSSMVDPYAPSSLGTREICRIAFTHDHSHPDHHWVFHALSNLKVPDTELKAQEWITAFGNCEIGAILYLKKIRWNPDEIQIKLTAKALCRRLPRELL